MPETCCAVFKRQVINLRSCCILFVDSVESIIMYGLAKPNIICLLYGIVISCKVWIQFQELKIPRFKV
jgi:hypothetical protein